jgi:hypothetical protein
MKTHLIAIPALLAALAACHSAASGNDVEEHKGPWAGDEIQNASLNNAIVSQHTLYPYHFFAGSAELNELGARDLNVLVAHFLTAAGDLNVHRGDTPQPLYESRVKTVLERLAAAGVVSSSVAVKDGMPGGDGVSSERVLVILKGKMSKGTAMTTGSNLMGSGTSGTGAIIQ